MEDVIVNDNIKTTKKVKEFKTTTKNNLSIIFKLDNGKMEFENEDALNKFKNGLHKLIEEHFGTVKKTFVF